MKKHTLLRLAIILLAVLAITVPFLNQAFHVDDREFIEFARLQLQHPFRFHLENYNFAGRNLETFRTTHPPLLSSFIAAVLWLYGEESEPVLHAAYLVFPVLAGISMYFLARRFCGRPLAAALLLVSSAGFLVASHTLMGDVPATAMWLAALACFIAGVDGSNAKLLAASGLLAGIAVMTAYQCLSLIPLMLLYLALNRKLTLVNVLPLVVPAAMFAVFAVYVLKTSGALPQLSYRIGVSSGWQDLPAKVRALLTFMGGTTIFSLSLILAFPGRRRQAFLALPVAAGVLFAGVAMPMITGGLSRLDAVIMTPMLIAGTVVVFGAIVIVIRCLPKLRGDPVAGCDEAFLAVWLIGVSSYILVLLPYVSVRYMLPLFPPLIILFIRGAEALFAGRPHGLNAFLTGTLVLGLLVALPVAVADFRLANIYRDFALRFRDDYKADGQRVWFLGEFDFRYYMEREGFPNLGEKAVAYSGDLVIRSELSGTSGKDVIIPVPSAEYSIIIEKIRAEDGFPLRVRNAAAGAGFYNHRIGPLPYACSRESLDEFTLYRLEW